MSGTRNAVRTRKNKERSKNFTELEKRTVLELISQHREVLRQGRSNNATNKSKQMVWSQICIEVNKRCRAECPRTPAQVKMWYENFKKKCKMRYQEPGSEDGAPNLLDGMLWTINPLGEPLTVKDERRDIPSTVLSNPSDDHLPVNMSSDRLDGSGSIGDSKDGLRHSTSMDLLEPQLSLTHSPGPTSPHPPPSPMRAHNLVPVITSNSSNPDSNGPLNLSHLEPRVCIDTPSPQDESSPNFPQFPNRCGNTQLNKKCPRGFFSRTSNTQDGCCNSDAILPHNNNNLGNYFCANSAPTEEEKLYYMAKRQHAIWEHEAKMKILNMELRQKEEIFSLQKQLFLIELKLKMDFLEKNSNK